MDRTRRDGFTLAELLVATTLAAIVMASVYTAFSTTIRLWRIGEVNIETFQDGRIALGIMRRDLYRMVPHSWHLMEGDEDSIEFFTVAQPMDVDTGTFPRLMWVRYELRRQSSASGRNYVLVREEREVRGELPLKVPGQVGDAPAVRTKLGRRHSFEIAKEVRDLKFDYIWVPVPAPRGPQEFTAPPQEVEPRSYDEPQMELGKPQAIRVTLKLTEPIEDGEEYEFATTVTYRDSLPSLTADDLVGGMTP